MRNIIKQVLKEEVDNRSERIKSIVNKYGIERALEIIAGGVKTIRQVYDDNPLEFLNQFNDLKPVEIDDVIYYVDKDKIPVFYYFPNNKNSEVFINYYIIWMFFSVVIELESSEIKGILKNWLKETYNITGFTPEWIERVKIDWKKPII